MFGWCSTLGKLSLPARSPFAFPLLSFDSSRILCASLCFLCVLRNRRGPIGKWSEWWW
ncbi:hypothetical protein ASPBRDRAFT_48005 [Aspergillus brasiliensis CBS 101740]|uniref:Uncharacterized protein n=1 Tax=Aspergillus brasiliensis (strain CBS 101740 / IMI 381727 / IBT 21946) TaxID=767769 RepID=A0A1L9U6Y9_ASPBC|nr:hypothetical protein ASPBRDRAFT_48005 [Aspergillus brasiliensis CBS 101740]